VSKRWYQENKRDPWRRQAKSKGYRARSAYKLLQIQEKFKIIKIGNNVLDIGCHPGGWTQVSVEIVGDSGIVVGVDLLTTSSIEGAEIIIGDITENSTIERIADITRNTKFDVIISDISPGLTGRYDTDQAISLELSTMALDTAFDLVKVGGNFITKIFQGRGVEGLVESAKRRFMNVNRYTPTASRTASSETYLICQNRLLHPRKGSKNSAMEEVKNHLETIGIITENEIQLDDETVVGFRKYRKAEET